MLFVLTLLGLSAFALPTAQVTLAWDPSPDSTVVGYRLYHGGTTTLYTNMVDIGKATGATISNLVQGATYYFAVTAYDASGLESAFSGEVSYTVPISTNTPVLARVSFVPGTPAVLSGTGNAGDVYTVLATSDLLSWQTLGTATAGLDGSFLFNDPGAISAPDRFYRVQRLQVGP